MTDQSLPRERPDVRRNGGSTPLDNDAWLSAGEAAGAQGIAVYVALCSYAFGRKAWARPSQASLARDAGVSSRTVRKVLTDLEGAELIRRESLAGRPSRIFITRRELEATQAAAANTPAAGADPTPAGAADEESQEEEVQGKNRPTSDFEDFWNDYGRRDTSKRNALREWDRLVASDDLPTQAYLLDQVRAYRASVFKGRPEKDARQYLLHPERWLKRHLFDAEYTEQGPRGGRLQPEYEPSGAGEEPDF